MPEVGGLRGVREGPASEGRSFEKNSERDSQLLYVRVCVCVPACVCVCVRVREREGEQMTCVPVKGNEGPSQDPHHLKDLRRGRLSSPAPGPQRVPMTVWLLVSPWFPEAG